MSSFRLVVEPSSNACRAVGELGFATAVDAHAELLKCLGSAGQVSIDCRELERIDSAGLAVLLDIVALARDRQVSLRYLNLPSGLLRLARLSGVEALLPV